MSLTYTSVAKMLSVVPAVGSVSTLTSADLVSFGEDAEALINAKLSKLYTVPISGAPPLLAMLATDISLYRVLALRIFTQEQANNSVWPDRFKGAMELLDKITEGDIALVDSSGTLISAPTAEAAVISDVLIYTPTMDERDPIEQQIDQDKLDDLGSAL